MRQTNSPSDRDCEPDICRQRQTFPKHHGCCVVWIGLFRVQPLMLERRQALRTLLRANKRLSTAHLPKDSFGQFQSYAPLCWSRRVFRELARIAQVATIEAVPEIRRDENNGTGVASRPVIAIKRTYLPIQVATVSG